MTTSNEVRVLLSEFEAIDTLLDDAGLADDTLQHRVMYLIAMRDSYRDELEGFIAGAIQVFHRAKELEGRVAALEVEVAAALRGEDE